MTTDVTSRLSVSHLTLGLLPWASAGSLWGRPLQVEGLPVDFPFVVLQARRQLSAVLIQ